MRNIIKWLLFKTEYKVLSNLGNAKKVVLTKKEFSFKTLRFFNVTDRSRINSISF